MVDAHAHAPISLITHPFDWYWPPAFTPRAPSIGLPGTTHESSIYRDAVKLGIDRQFPPTPSVLLQRLNGKTYDQIADETGLTNTYVAQVQRCQMQPLHQFCLFTLNLEGSETSSVRVARQSCSEGQWVTRLVRPWGNYPT